MNHWGYHTLLDCGGCDLQAITNPKVLTAWVKELVDRIEMVPYGEPQVIHFGKNEYHLAGWTVIQLIETSNIDLDLTYRKIKELLDYEILRIKENI